MSISAVYIYWLLDKALLREMQIKAMIYQLTPIENDMYLNVWKYSVLTGMEEKRNPHLLSLVMSPD